MASEFAEKVKSIGVLRGGRTRPVVREGKAHPDSGLPYKATTDEAGNTVTEHANDRQDVHIHVNSIEGATQNGLGS